MQYATDLGRERKVGDGGGPASISFGDAEIYATLHRSARTSLLLLCRKELRLGAGYTTAAPLIVNQVNF